MSKVTKKSRQRARGRVDAASGDDVSGPYYRAVLAIAELGKRSDARAAEALAKIARLASNSALITTARAQGCASDVREEGESGLFEVQRVSVQRDDLLAVRDLYSAALEYMSPSPLRQLTRLARADGLSAATMPGVEHATLERAAAVLNARSHDAVVATVVEVARMVQNALFNAGCDDESSGAAGGAELDRASSDIVDFLSSRGGKMLEGSRVATWLRSWAPRPRRSRLTVLGIVTRIVTASRVVQRRGAEERIKKTLARAGIKNEPRAYLSFGGEQTSEVEARIEGLSSARLSRPHELTGRQRLSP